MQVLLQVIVLTALFLLGQELFRRASKWIVWSVFLLVPLVATPYWIATNDFGPFLWIKCYSVFFCVCWGTLLRFSTLHNRPWMRRTVPLLLAANILEATLVDVLEVGLSHSWNAITGFALIAMVPYGAERVRVETAGRFSDGLYDTPRSWIVGYTLWNWVFVSLNFPALLGYHTAVLLAALIVGGYDPRRWLHARAFTLGIDLLLMANYNDGMQAWLDASNWHNATVEMVAAGLTLAYVGGLAVRGVVRSRHAGGWKVLLGPRSFGHAARTNS